jgi:hypothetical protein
MVDIMNKLDMILQTSHCAREYEARFLWGAAIGVLTYGCTKRLTKCLATYAWCVSVQAQCFANIAAINALPDGIDEPIPTAYIDYSNLGAPAYTAVDLYNEINAAPAITSISPTNGSAGITVTITGTNFTGTTAVTFNGINATSFNVVNNTSIFAVVPLGFIGGHISVTNAVGMVISDQLFVRG